MSKLPSSGYSTAAESTAEGYLAKKFAKMRLEQKRAKEAQEKAEAEAKVKVSAIIRVRP